MPTGYVHGALIDMYHVGGGAPWIFPLFQERTGIVLAVGSSDIPSPKTWTDDERAQVDSFFRQYKAKPDAAAKRKFSTISGKEVPGAELWRKFISEGWKTWKITDSITRVLTQKRFHPIILMQYSSRPDVWPEADTYIPQVMDDIAIELFGEEALDGLGRLKDSLHSSVKVLIQRTWISIYNKYSKAKATVKAYEEEATRALESELIPFLIISVTYCDFYRCLGGLWGRCCEGHHRQNFEVESGMRGHTIKVGKRQVARR